MKGPVHCYIVTNITWQMPVPFFSRFCRSIECLFTLYSAKIHIFLVLSPNILPPVADIDTLCRHFLQAAALEVEECGAVLYLIW